MLRVDQWSGIVGSIWMMRATEGLLRPGCMEGRLSHHVDAGVVT
jgi:hypothetical protein